MEYLVLLLVVLASILVSDGLSLVDVCKNEDIKKALTRDGAVTVRTPSKSRNSNCQPSFVVPANFTLDISIVSEYVPKKTFGTEQHCVKVKLGGSERVLDCSPDGSGIFSMKSYTKVIYRSPLRSVPLSALVDFPTWDTNFRVMLELRSPLNSSWSFDPSVTRVLVEESQITLTCPHDNERLIPKVLHDGVADKESKEIHLINAKMSDSGRYVCDYGDKKDNKVDAVTNIYRVVVAGRELLTSQREIFNASVGDRFALYCSAQFYVGSMREMPASDWDRIHDILAAQYRERLNPTPNWLSLHRISWSDITDVNNPLRVTEATGNLSLHTNDVPGTPATPVDASGDLVNVGDISTPYFALSKIVDLVIKEEDEGKTLTYQCYYDDQNTDITGGIPSSHVKVHVNAAEPLIDIELSPTTIAIVVVALVLLVLFISGIAVCCVRGLPGRGANKLREDNPLARSNGWAQRAETEPFTESAPSPITPTQNGVLYQPRGPDPHGLDDDDHRSGSPNGDVFFGSTFSASPPKLPSPNANGAPYTSGHPKWPSSSRDSRQRSFSDTDGDHDVSLSNETYGVLLKSPNNVAVAT